MITPENAPNDASSSVQRNPDWAGARGQTLLRVVQGTVLLGAIAVLVLSLWVYESGHQSETLSELATAQAKELDGQLRRLAELPTVLASDPRLIAPLERPEPHGIDIANTLLAQIQQQTDIGHAYLMDTTGLTLASSNHATTNSFVGQNYGFRRYFAEAVRGRRGTQYAVGATTGEPGYFVSQPVRAAGAIVGVLVFKLSLAHLSDIWAARDERTLLIDDAGIVILTNSSDMLYASTRPLTDKDVANLRQVRHYPVSKIETADLLEDPPNLAWRNDTFLAATARLTAENWRVMVLSPRSKMIGQVLRDFSGALAIIGVFYLLVRDWWRQRRLVLIEQQNAHTLANQIAEKSRELELAQRSLIENSNLAALGRMSSAINHEVNQPLASLRLNLASLATMADSPEADLNEIADTVRDCERTTKRISRVVAALRSLARPGDTRFLALDANRLMSDVIKTVTAEQPAAQQLIQYTSPLEPLSFEGNAVLLQQAVLNLLHNAINAARTADTPQVWVEFRCTELHILIVIEDNGKGVGAELSEKLFEPFVQGNDSTKGLGLGLALARQIALYHHGALTHERTQDGKTQFTIQLPGPSGVSE